MDEQIKEDIINLDYYTQRELRYKRFEESEKILAEKIRKEVANNIDSLPYFDDLKHTIEWSCTNLTKEILDKYPFKELAKKKYFIQGNGNNGWNILHYAASNGNTEILKALYNFEKNTVKKLFGKKNDNNETPYELAEHRHYEEFCNTINMLGQEEYGSTTEM